VTGVYAYVQDVAAEWDTYEHVARALGDVPPAGMILRVAGETAVGFRVIEVWDSQGTWERFRDLRLRPAMRSVHGDAADAPATFSDFAVRRAMFSSSFTSSAIGPGAPLR
jgi:hypothetical protein